MAGSRPRTQGSRLRRDQRAATSALPRPSWAGAQWRAVVHLETVLPFARPHLGRFEPGPLLFPPCCPSSFSLVTLSSRAQLVQGRPADGQAPEDEPLQIWKIPRFRLPEPISLVTHFNDIKSGPKKEKSY